MCTGLVGMAEMNLVDVLTRGTDSRYERQVEHDMTSLFPEKVAPFDREYIDDISVTGDSTTNINSSSVFCLLEDRTPGFPDIVVTACHNIVIRPNLVQYSHSSSLPQSDTAESCIF